jgi:hypothetical protein
MSESLQGYRWHNSSFREIQNWGGSSQVHLPRKVHPGTSASATGRRCCKMGERLPTKIEILSISMNLSLKAAATETRIKVAKGYLVLGATLVKTFPSSGEHFCCF